MPAPNATTLTLLALLPLVAWRTYTRVRRMIGRQPFSRLRPWITLLVLPLLLWLLGTLAWMYRPQSLGWLFAGLAAGAGLSLVGLSRTRFEATPAGAFYTPDTRLGVAISLLFMARVAWRVAEILIHGAPPPGQPDAFATSPFTLGLIGLFAGYYMGYAAGLLRWGHRLSRSRIGGASDAP